MTHFGSLIQVAEEQVTEMIMPSLVWCISRYRHARKLERVEEEGNMSDVIKEIFADQFHKCEAEARAQGEASKMIEQIMKKYKKGCSVAETADMLEENPSVIEQIYDILRQNAPDYDVQKIYQLLLKKNTQDSLT